MTEPIVDTEPRPAEETPDGAAAADPDLANPPEVSGPPTHEEPARRDRSVRGFLRRSGGVGLRRRILLTFTLGSLTLSAFLAVTTYGLVRSNLIEQRYTANRQTAYADANTVLRELASGPATLTGASEKMRQLAVQRPVIYYKGTWSVGLSRFGNQELPPSLVTKVLQQGVDARMITKVSGDTVMV